jgi:uncharacterized protein YbjT (DUF2867 family)
MSKSSRQTVLVTGATGTTGSALLRLLEERGFALRAMIRHKQDVAKLGDTSASIVIGDFDDAGSIVAALDSVDSAYLVTPSSIDAEAQQIRFAELAAAARVRHLVKLSQLGAKENSPVRFLRYHAAVERRILELGLGYTFLRPNLFFQGLLAFKAMIADEGRFFAPIGDARVSAVDIRDIALVAAVVLTQPGHVGKTYTITGPAAVTHGEIAHAIAGAIGREVKFIDVSPEDFAFALRKIGMPPWQVNGLVEDYAHYVRGEAAEVYPTIREVARTVPRDVSGFARDYASAFGSQRSEPTL